MEKTSIKKTKVPVNISKLPESVQYFKDIDHLEIDEDDLYKLAIFKQEVPADHVAESEYMYLMSKVPHYIALYKDFISITESSIINKSKDDRLMKDISEIVGIALGIKITIDHFGIRQENIRKIPPPSKKQKYLDYQFTYNGYEFHLETKGTTSTSITRFIDDIVQKKAVSTNAHFRYGTVAVLTKPTSTHKTELYICDDPPAQVSRVPEDGRPWHYIAVLEFILDNKYYNQVAKAFLYEKHIKRPKIQKIRNGFFGEYISRFKICWRVF